jgi:hypothetical protein
MEVTTRGGQAELDLGPARARVAADSHDGFADFRVHTGEQVCGQRLGGREQDGLSAPTACPHYDAHAPQR